MAYRSVPPVSVTSTISSRTARISFPLLVVSRMNSAKFGDMIIIVSFTRGVGSRDTVINHRLFQSCLPTVWDLQDVISLLNRDNHRSLP